MRTVNASMSTAIALGQVKVAELYTITLPDGTVHRYTSHDADIIWDAGSNTYTSFPIAREAVKYSNSFESDTVKVIMANISGALYSQVQENILEACQVSIRRILWDDTYAADKEIIIFLGWADISFDRKMLILDCRPLEDSLNIMVPRNTYEEPCTLELFGPVCSLTQSDYAYTSGATSGTNLTLIDAARGSVYTVDFDAGDETAPLAVNDTITGDIGAATAVVCHIVYKTATTGTIWYCEHVASGAVFVNNEVLSSGGNDVTVNGTPAADTVLYEMGELEMTSGDNSGFRRPIHLDAGTVITVMWPFPASIANTDTYKIYPGCDKQGATCRDRFGNVENFRGYVYIPKPEEVKM